LRDRSLVTIVLVLVALFAPLYGMAFSGLVAWDRNRRGQRTMRNLALGCFVLALIVFLTPVLALPRLAPFLR
jgi:H+/Cl- antiporter ClcA